MGEGKGDFIGIVMNLISKGSRKPCSFTRVPDFLLMIKHLVSCCLLRFRGFVWLKK
jgi:hypothetical protein